MKQLTARVTRNRFAGVGSAIHQAMIEAVTGTAEEVKADALGGARVRTGSIRDSVYVLTREADGYAEAVAAAEADNPRVAVFDPLEPPASDSVPAMLTPGEMVLSRGMLSGSMPAPVLPAPLLLSQLPSAGHAPLVSAFTEALANTQGARPISVNAPVSIGTVNQEADENRLIDNFGRRLEQTLATYSTVSHMEG